ncbi:hypothetical protein GIB67_005159 [Kingdonia uniflora]|uniref:Uncharacterized protein n=1 Tax=Kingdonia uniflora TaxID=39325 RepID=A0A7J7NMU9_9MAGN|nr:hypothetical protein GIB67_005159 [Kingdonia uniflora]
MSSFIEVSKRIFGKEEVFYSPHKNVWGDSTMCLVEKMELREEKVKLKTEKVRLEQAVKVMSVPSPLVPHPSFHAAAAATFAANKSMPYQVNYPPPMAMWQWMPPASLDTSQDLVLRPPVE